MNNTTETLKPCPFCGAPPIIRMNSLSSDIPPAPYAVCTDCGAGLPVEKWNRRAPTATEAELREAIKDAMEEIGNLPCGITGEQGPTLEELDDHVKKTGRSFDDDAIFHTGQRAWRILDNALAHDYQVFRYITWQPEDAK